MKGKLPVQRQEDLEWTPLKSSNGVNMSNTGPAQMIANWNISHLICNHLCPPAETHSTGRALASALTAPRRRIRHDTKTTHTQRRCLGHLTTTNGCDWETAQSEGACICFDTATKAKTEPEFITTLMQASAQMTKLERLEALARDALAAHTWEKKYLALAAHTTATAAESEDDDNLNETAHTAQSTPRDNVPAAQNPAKKKTGSKSHQKDQDAHTAQPNTAQKHTARTMLLLATLAETTAASTTTH
ncbi:hypothetical protein ERJ75_000345300 [Trypanosoma vivax]|nr:hypothetical protein ERJ75_000345300 [Trypanosoma vivax]